MKLCATLIISLLLAIGLNAQDIPVKVYSNNPIEREREFLHLLSESFTMKPIVRISSALFWSKCLGANEELHADTLREKLDRLLTDSVAKRNCYRRLNYYLSSTLELYTYLQVFDASINWWDSTSKNPPPPPPPPPPSRILYDYLISFGEDTLLGKCDVGGLDESIGATPSAYVAPEFPGGQDSLIRYMTKHVVYPQYDKFMLIQGKVPVKFTVCPDGSIGGVTVPKGISKGLDAEAMRVVKMLPRFKPGTMKGVAVPVYFTLPVVFKLG